MKTFLYISVILLVNLIHSNADGQHIFVAPVIETTIIGAQYGGSCGFMNKKGAYLAAFYQKNRTSSEVWPSYSIHVYGLLVSAPIITADKLTFAANLRTGISNDNFLVFIPGIETRISIKQWLQPVVGVSSRYGHAAISASLLLKL